MGRVAGFGLCGISGLLTGLEISVGSGDDGSEGELNGNWSSFMFDILGDVRLQPYVRSETELVLDLDLEKYLMPLRCKNNDLIFAVEAMFSARSQVERDAGRGCLLHEQRRRNKTKASGSNSKE